MREMDRQEAAGVVQRGQQALHELVQVQAVDQELQVDRDHRNQPAAGRRPQQLTVLLAVPRDVVLAGLGGALHHLARQLRER
ncbi:hypothetical protein D3C72_1162890 [compost metagenome]